MILQAFLIQKNCNRCFSILFPAVSKSMPQFHQMMGERLRTAEQGADTVVWLAVSRAAARTRSGQFFQGETWAIFFLCRTNITVIFIFIFTPVEWKFWSSQSPAPVPSLMQIARPSLPTFLWPGLTVLPKRLRVLWLSWRNWPDLFSLRFRTQNQTVHPALWNQLSLK